MSEQIDWSKAPEGATHYQAATHGVFECWLKPGHAVRVSRRDPDWREDDYADDLIATSAIKRPWSGEGLPPVGVVCEVEYDDGRQIWHEAEVIYHKKDGPRIAAAMLIGEGRDKLVWVSQFRPIRTPEQIAADEREAAIKEIQREIMPADEYVAEIILDAITRLGYRKP